MLEQVKTEAGLVITPEPKEKTLKDITVKELKKIAKKHKIAGYSKMKKPELVKALS